MSMHKWHASPQRLFPMYGFLLGILVWLLDGIIDYWAFSPSSLFDVLFLTVHPNVLFLRILIVLSFTLGGYLIGSMLYRARAKEREYSAFVETTPDMFLLINNAGVLLEVNQVVSDRLDCTAEELIGLHIKNLLPKEDPGIDLLMTKIQQEMSVRFESSLQYNGQNKIPVDISASHFPGNDGRILIFARDISRQEATIQSLKESRHKYQALFHHMNSGFAVHKLITNDENIPIDYQFLQINTQFTEITGLSPDILGKTARDVIPNLDHDPVNWVKRYGQVVQTGEPTHFEAYSAQLDKWFAVSAYRSAPHEFATVFEDITNQKETERELNQERKLLEQITETVPVGVVKIDAEGKILYANQRAEEILGLTRSEIAGRAFDDPKWRVTAVDGSDFPEEMYPFNQVKRQGKPVYDNEHAIEWPNGERRIISVNATPLKDKDGQFAGMVASIRDITDHMHAQMALKQSQELLAETQRVAKIGGWEVDVRTQQVHWTEETYRIHDVPVERTIDIETGVEFFPGAAETIIRDAVEKAISEGKSYELELPFVDASGNRKWVRTIGQPLLQGDSVVKLRGTIQDITQEKEKEDEQRRIYAAVEQLSEAVIITDTTPAIEYVNPAFWQITGYAPEEVIGKNPSLLQSGKHDLKFYEDLWDTLTSGNVWSGVFINKKKDGALYQEESAITPIQNLEGRISNYVAVKRDITQEVHLEEQFRQSQKLEAVGRLAGGVAHDFNNILTIISGYGEMLLQATTDESLQTKVQNILTAAERAKSLTRQLLTFSRKQTTDSQIVHVNNLIGNYHRMLQRLISDDVHLRFTPGENIPAVWIDPAQLEQVLMNLIINAEDAISRGGDIHIETGLATPPPGMSLPDSQDTVVEIRISDTGCGMPPEVQEKIFEPFYTTKEAGEGTGLGLSTVYGIVTKYNGHIIVDSEESQGTTFSLYLPPTKKQPGNSLPDTAAKEINLSALHILLVDDDQGVLNYLSTVLERNGCIYETASSVEEAIKCLENYESKWDLVITDVVLSDGNGLQLAEKCRKYQPDIRILFISGYPSTKLEEYGMRRDMQLLEKPFQPRELLACIQELMLEPGDRVKGQ
ncbi:MAG: PAS domain S-box protein [Candidatus Marinimicrobia bacterium]|nr:PAS domain S-box protein [Candidatus Neomarinimicrobiota bacterium]